MPRQARLDFPGTLHHVMVRGIERKKIVADDGDRKSFISRIGKVALETGTVIYAWTLMTNHAHILLRSGKDGLSQFMRRVLTGYAVAYNLRHGRYGHLFQNRYKSIVCDEDAYLLELVRYIHLNPIRAGVIKSMADLDRYQHCGHSVLMGRVKHDWQDRDYILRQFGNKEGEAKRRYREFVEAGIREGRRLDLVGGGLIRSQGGWSQVVTLRRKGIREMSDERILGSSEFVERILDEAEERVKRQFPAFQSRKKIEEIIRTICREEGVSQVELQGGSRRGRIPVIRIKIANKLVTDHGVIMAEAARHLGVSTSALSKAMK
ncbi:MAG: transposase, partial [Nitrospirota bacterium]|nr:transposase [Nitrospirota bacterium]